MWIDGRPEYFDICHPAKGQPHTSTVLWVHNGRAVESRSAKGGKEHNDFWEGSHIGSGRVDTAKGVGALGLASGIGRRKARKVAEDVIAGFPGIRFWVFHEGDWGVPMQEFWEATS